MHYAEAATPAKSAGSAVAKKHLEAKQKIGFVHGIDGTIATIAPAASKVTVPYNTVLEIAVSATNIANALVFNLEKDGSIGVILLDNISEVRSGQDVYATGSLLKIPVGFHMLGKIINPLGKEIPTGLFTKAAPLLDDTKLGLVEEMAPNIVSRQPVNYNLLTGYKVIDTLIPVGRGQRELILGDRQTGKTSIALSTILNQTKVNNEILSKNNVLSVYVSIGQRCSNVARIHRLLTEYDAMKYCTIVAATAADPAGLQYLAPYAGTTLGEEFRNSGRHILLVYDDLSKQAVSYRQISLLLRRPPGREAYPGDVFYLHSRLLERSAMMSPQKGSGSLTSLPIVETLSNDVTAYIVTNVISITDGQIYLDAKLFTGGQRPAVNIGLSVSRVGSSAQNKAMKKVGGALKMLMGEYRKMAGEQTSGSQNVSPVMIRGARCLQLFNQKGPSYFMDAIVALYAVTNGYMDDVKLQYSKFYEFLLLNKDLPVLYGQVNNKYFYMYNKNLNYFIRYFGLNHEILEPELKKYIEIHTNLFLDNYQSRMNELKSDEDLVQLKNLLYACKRTV
uniref:ATP synthase subunit alpha n=1 Tax=Euglena gracilis TaxID=3039 RepID=UPI0012B67DD0|nr:Chain AA, ATP synthase subunit alpha [Euglena gracilis]6TDU_AB Chain AB, ATP synthase subunit alpha [Euglena gracilis]6TDU_AC Chain AC, ATP synthase subunit alpha [Euglena gracilis]6TDU_BA Chain BA, ATP synthase subunit alpha [Euglena gracilis]6TDU_BB Chain BB, ATP synthase subunit alpha [Euglena gracilis]6TDU_BC Chain BC, ATP synthase subunit alpha [Euglena gracilis]6TDY_A Chain A, ATP synthase subunit alpha [Euglena gracilis]6TDY_B Chain B, ATP synthase subunit alpha [Euglena gracilis]